MSKQPLHQPGDKLFKAVFKHPATAAGVLRRHIPDPLSDLLEWDSLRLQPGSYVDERFKASESDLLYRVKLRGKKSSDAFLYLLFEHQTKKDPWLALRLLGYLVRIWEDFRKANRGARTLPVIVPVVLVQSERSWKLSPRFASLFGGKPETPEECAEFVPDFAMRLIELSEIPFDRIEGTALGVMALRVLKAERAKDLLNDMVWDERLLGSIWRESPGDLRMLLLYMFHADVDKNAFRNKVEKVVHPEIRLQAMSVVEQIKQEGRQEGRQEGALIGKIELLRQVLGSDAAAQEDLTTLSKKELEDCFNKLDAAYRARFKTP